MTEELPEYDLTLYPEPVLRKPAEPIQAFDEDLTRVVNGMLARMHASNGVGLAAPQVGLDVVLLVLEDLRGHVEGGTAKRVREAVDARRGAAAGVAVLLGVLGAALPYRSVSGKMQRRP